MLLHLFLGCGGQHRGRTLLFEAMIVKISYIAFHEVRQVRQSSCENQILHNALPICDFHEQGAITA